MTLSYPRSMLHSAIVGRDISVENMTSFVANSGSISYLTARMMVVAPAGIAARITLIPSVSLPMGRNLHTSQTTAGIMIKRWMEKRKTRKSHSCRKSILERIMPTTIMERPVLQLPTAFTIPISPDGSFQFSSMNTMPMTQAMMQGCVTTLTTCYFQSRSPVNMGSPDDHIMMRSGIR